MATSIQTHIIRKRANGTRIVHLSNKFSVAVIFQIRAADPEKDVGADITTFSDASLLFIVNILLKVQKTIDFATPQRQEYMFCS